MHRSEKQFADVMKAREKVLKYHPCTFRMGHTTYTPDFYCADDDIYYEVKKTCSSREAAKIISFKKAYPKIALKVVSPSGYPYYCPGSDAYIAVIEKVVGILLTKDITEITEQELHFLGKTALQVKGARRPCYEHSRPLRETIRKAGVKRSGALATRIGTAGRGRA